MFDVKLHTADQKYKPYSTVVERKEEGDKVE
jgi:hypothetical protein